MRIIKFRAWNKPRKVMIYDKDYSVVLLREDDDFILMQYTGLNDKNDKPIYEGDILDEKFEKVVIIRWEKAYSGYQWCLIDPKDDEPNDFYGGMGNIDYKSIVGNIYENPDLLK